jgi:hypothetical protein
MALLIPSTSRGFLAIVGAALLCCAHPAAQAPETLENDVKAAFLFNFTKFVDWPAAAFAGETDTLRVCVVADAAFTRSVDRIIEGETVRGRPLRRVVPGPSEIARCHVLYVGDSEMARAHTFLSSVGYAPVLTVGESPRFIEQGGTISFIVVNDRVRFDVNLRAAARARLTVSSKLLRVARHLEEHGPS